MKSSRKYMYCEIHFLMFSVSAASNELHPSFQPFSLTHAPQPTVQPNPSALFTPINHALTSQLAAADDQLDCVASTLDGSLIGLTASSVDSLVTSLPLMTQCETVEGVAPQSGRQSTTGSASPGDVTAVLSHSQAIQIQSTLERLTSSPTNSSSPGAEHSHSPTSDAILATEASPPVVQAPV